MEPDLLRNNYLSLGVSYMREGKTELAAKFFEAGVQECERLNLRDLGTAALIYNLVVAYEKLGNIAEFELSLLRCLQLCRQYGGREHSTLPLVSRLISHYYFRKGNKVSARYHLRQASKDSSLHQIELLDHVLKIVEIAHPSHNGKQYSQQICNRNYALVSEQIHKVIPFPGATTVASQGGSLSLI